MHENSKPVLALEEKGQIISKTSVLQQFDGLPVTNLYLNLSYKIVIGKSKSSWDKFIKPSKAGLFHGQFVG